MTSQGTVSAGDKARSTFASIPRLAMRSSVFRSAQYRRSFPGRICFSIRYVSPWPALLFSKAHSLLLLPSPAAIMARYNATNRSTHNRFLCDASALLHCVALTHEKGTSIVYLRPFQERQFRCLLLGWILYDRSPYCSWLHSAGSRDAIPKQEMLREKTEGHSLQ